MIEYVVSYDRTLIEILNYFALHELFLSFRKQKWKKFSQFDILLLLLSISLPRKFYQQNDFLKWEAKTRWSINDFNLLQFVTNYNLLPMFYCVKYHHFVIPKLSFIFIILN